MEKIDVNTYLADLMNQYTNLIYSICYKITNNSFDAQDLTQETFLSVYKNLPSFDGTNEKAWITRIATNKCLDYIKSAGKRTLPTEDTYFEVMESPISTPEQTYLEKSDKEQILFLCQTLKPPYDTIATYYFYEEMTVAEIAMKSGKKVKTIQTQVYRAKSLLKSKWRKEIS
ncbi:MAG: RNA polymerase sigma factor [Acetivibrio sp.]